jgi:hypothetical protein
MGIFTYKSPVRQGRAALLILVFGILLVGCRASSKAVLQITYVPVADAGGPLRMDFIQGRVSGAKPGQSIVLYARGGGAWWIQPLFEHPFTQIQADSTWKSTTHLGSDYAALLVEPGYHPALKTGTLPTVGNGVVRVVVAKGQTPAATAAPKMIHFSGYDWAVQAAESDRAGGGSPYDPANAWTDQKGYLHLRMALLNGRWTCAEVNLTRSLGYGTYTFVVGDTSHLSPAAVLGMYTLDLGGTTDSSNELDIEVSRWGNPTGRNAQYVVQPFYVPQNVFRFTAPAGVLTHTLRWEPGVASFQTTLGSTTKPGGKIVSSHLFTSEIPTPATETPYIDLFDFHHSFAGEQRPSEVVIEKFEYLP